MNPPVRLSGIGIACSSSDGAHAAGKTGHRLSAALSALPQGGSPARLFHPIEGMAFLAAHEALSFSRIALPVEGDGIWIALGVDEGIDGIKARYYQGVLRDGPLGASPLAFPLTAPNTIAARISILLDLRGESLTVCGGCLSGAQAIGLAMEALREGRSGAVLAGGATSVEQEFLDALCRAGRVDGGQPRCGACLLLLEPQVPAGDAGPHDSGPLRSGAGDVLGYGEGFGENDIRDAVQACLEDARLLPEQIGSVRVASLGDYRRLVEALRQVRVKASAVRSPSSEMYSASFPMVVAEVAGQAANGAPQPVLVVGTDCLVGAAAAIVQCGRR
jgi:Beta-ketoacyl synthase, N-terminal domain